MFENHPCCSTPNDDVRLWRYMNLSQFIDLITSRTLYFSTVNELDDKWEGALPTPLIDSFSGGPYVRRSNESLEAHVQRTYSMFRDFQRTIRLNCWHRNDVESVAMWHLYTNGIDGVAIVTTVQRLKVVLNSDEHKFLISEMRYMDYEKENITTLNALLPVLAKRHSFRHETEVRVILQLLPSELSEQIASSNPSGSGRRVSIDTVHLIECIIVSPDYPEWYIGSLQELVTRAGLHVDIEKSDLLRHPILS